MAETPPATETNQATPDTQDQATASSIEQSQSGGGDLKVALSQERQEKQAIKAEKDALARQVEELSQKVSELSKAQLPDNERVQAEFREMTAQKVLSRLDQDAFNKLPSKIKEALSKDPWAFVDQKSIDKETRFAETLTERFQILGRLAEESIREIISDEKTDGNTQTQTNTEKKEDPSESAGTKQEDILPGGFTEAELFVLAQADPKKFQEIRKGLKQQ